MITGDDLPAAGPQLVVCVCMSELFRVVINGGEMVAECSGCGSTAHRWAIAGAAPQATTFYRDTLPAADQRGVPVASAAWLDPETSGRVTGSELAAGADTEAEIREAMGRPAALPAYSKATCNVHLSGGDYDGQDTWLAPGVTEFMVAGMQGRYVPDPHGAIMDCDDGVRRPVMVFVPVPEV